MGKLGNYIRNLAKIDPDDYTEKELDQLIDPYNKILSKKNKGKIFIGNYKAAKNKKFFKDNDIKAVLNANIDCVPHHYKSDKEIEYMRIPVDDALKTKDFIMMYKFLPVAIEFIHKHVDLQKNNIFVGCYQGAQRSVTCVVGYLMKYHHMTPETACAYVLSKRPVAFWFGTSLNFEKSINQFYKKKIKHK